ncbi:MAG: ankyrin repeat domain-containing protein [Spirochaetales bacterium]|jgi:ankyrin repeat protein|nr:ankyrin repeat domain-containing protein [Spirochaetales bacterium]
MKTGLSVVIVLLITSFTVYCQSGNDNPVIKAVASGDPVKVKSALESNRNINVDERDSYGGTALHGAMFIKNAEIVKLLIQHGYDVNAIGPRNGYTPLHDAIWANYPEGAKLLIVAGADAAIKNHDGLTPLELARKDGKKELIGILEQARKQ